MGEIAESALRPGCQLLELTGGAAVAPQGSGICSSSVLHGMVFKKETEGDVTSVKDAKIAVYSCPFDGMITETKVCGPQDLTIRDDGRRLAGLSGCHRTLEV